MTINLNYVINERSRNRSIASFEREDLILTGKGKCREVRQFHESFKEYDRTPLHKLDNLGESLGLNNVWIKDESFRFGLNAFKVLGGTYAVGKYIAQKSGLELSEITPEKLKKINFEQMTFVTATDGNHGRGVAWAANRLGQKSVVFMPKGSTIPRLENIRAEGAMAEITELNYDDAVRHAMKYAEEHDGILLQDTAWEGYEEIPTWIMQGYSTIIQEALEQFNEAGVKKPTHVFLQAGVGSFAGSMLGYLTSELGDDRPVSIIVEPENADCIYKSAKINDGNPHSVGGALQTAMAGLACGEPNTITWGILRDFADMYISCSDEVAASGMRVLASPLKGDPQVVSGESGAVGLGLIRLIMEQKDQYADMREILKLDENSEVLIISTEGDTDPDYYKKIVWDGVLSSSVD